MDIINLLVVIVVSCLWVLFFYSIIRWGITFVLDRSNTDKRKKYARLCLICILIMGFLMLISLAINIKRNMM